MARRVRYPTKEACEEKLKSGEWQIHKFPRGFLITEVQQYPEERVLFIHLLSGEDFDNWKWWAHDTLRDFAKKMNCSGIECAARLGLEKKLKTLNYNKKKVLLRHTINENLHAG